MAKYLVSCGKLTNDALRRAERTAEETRSFIEPVLTHLGLVSEGDMADAFARTLGLSRADTQQLATDPDATALLSTAFLRHAHVLPQERNASGLGLAMANPGDDYKAFFFKKKKQKTFLRWVRDSIDKSFLVLFSKKNLFLILSFDPTAASCNTHRHPTK